MVDKLCKYMYAKKKFFGQQAFFDQSIVTDLYFYIRIYTTENHKNK